MHYDTATLRKMCDIWEKHGSGLIALHGQSGDIMFQGCSTENVQPAFDELNENGFDMGGAGPALRTSMSCVGHARCEQSCYDEVRAHRSIINAFLDEMHRPALPYKFKFKFSGCANDCVNAIHRADFAVIGTWRDDMKVDQAEVKNYIDQAGRKYTIDNVIARCPTNALSLNDDDTLEVDNSSCVRCMHCLNVMNKALSPGDDKGVTILIGGKRSLKIGDQMGTVVVPFLKLESDEDFERLEEIAENVIEFFAENALEHERIGETIDRIGLVNFLDGVGVEIDPNMVNHPRTNSYVDTAEWDQEADKWLERKAGEAAE